MDIKDLLAEALVKSEVEALDHRESMLRAEGAVFVLQEILKVIEEDEQIPEM